MTTATTTPYATPPSTTSSSRNAPCPNVNGFTIASTASPNAVSATPSLIRLSPSRIVTTRVGAPSRVSTEVAATASVGATAAANASAPGQPTAGSTSRVTAPTPTIVTVVAPTASAVIGTAFSRVSRGAEKNAALYTSGGKNRNRTTSGGRSMFGTCGMRLASTPKISRMIASGTSSRLATNRPMIITTAIATASVKSSYSPTGLSLKRVRRRTVTEWPAGLVHGYPLNVIQAAIV